jgi:hypothetical protein
MRYSKHNGIQRTMYDHVIADKAARAEERDRVRADRAADDPCGCGWITGRPVCPNCGGHTGLA